MIHNPTHHQPRLFEIEPEVVFESPGAARTYYGQAMEELVCKALGAVNIPINGNYEINFDAKRGKTWFEIKSVRDLPSSKSVIYDWRMKKEEPHAPRLKYVFGLHKVKDAGCISDIWEMLEANGARLLIAPAAVVHELAGKQPLKKIRQVHLDGAKRRDGYARKGYREGYRNLPIGALLDLDRKTRVAKKTVVIYERKIKIEIISIL